MQCMMIWHHLNTNPSRKFCKNLNNFEKSQKFSKTPNFRSKDMKCMIKRGIKDLTREEEQDQGKKSLGNEVWSEREKFRRWKGWKQSREIEDKWSHIARIIYIENHNPRQIESCQELKSTREAIKELSKGFLSKGARWIDIAIEQPESISMECVINLILFFGS